MKYIKQLDSLRAIAVLMVIVSHWFQFNENTLFNIPLGPMGVYVFFVLSGYLITNILFNQRIESETKNIPRLTLIKNFYARRTLRIFPIYYLTILFLLVFSRYIISPVKEGLFYYLTYTSNFHIFFTKNWDGIFSHFWSLAVEEQFYLIWPWLILFVNRKYLLHILLIFIIIGVGSQYFLKGIKMIGVLPFTCFDAFGIGGLLSWILINKKEKINSYYKISTVAALVSVFLFVLGLYQNAWYFVPVRIIVSIITVWIIFYIILNQDKNTLSFKIIFNNKVLIFLGKISYGLYLYHNLIPSIINSQFINKYLNPHLPNFLLKNYIFEIFVLENTILLLIISTFSFYFIEKKFLALKSNFETVK